MSSKFWGYCGGCGIAFEKGVKVFRPPHQHVSGYPARACSEKCADYILEMARRERAS